MRIDRPALVARAVGRRFQQITGSQLFAQVRELSLGLTHLGIAPGDCVYATGPKE